MTKTSNRIAPINKRITVIEHPHLLKVVLVVVVLTVLACMNRLEGVARNNMPHS